MNNLKAGMMVITAVLAAALTFAGLGWLQTRSAAQAQAAPVTAEAARQRWACVYGRTLDEARLETMTNSAAQAVGLQQMALKVATAPGPIAGRSRVVRMEVRAAGTMDTLLGFLRLAVYEKPALEVETLDLSSAESLVTMRLTVAATCAL
jgi:hypothetical protein